MECGRLHSMLVFRNITYIMVPLHILCQRVWGSHVGILVK